MFYDAQNGEFFNNFNEGGIMLRCGNIFCFLFLTFILNGNAMETMLPPTLLYINGDWVSGHGESFDAIDPFHESIIAQVSSADKKDVDLAVDAAEKTFKTQWRATNYSQRANYFDELAHKIEKNATGLAQLESMNSGRPISIILESEIPFIVAHLRKNAEHMRYFDIKEQLSNIRVANNTQSKIRRVPLGVVGLIIPWNYPLVMLFWKLTSAIGAGNTVVVKPSEKTPLSALAIAQLSQDIFPPGVLNIVNGDGKVGAFIAKHPKIAHVGFTGSTSTGAKVRAAATESNMKGVSLELGGKSPLIISKNTSADLELATSVALNGIFSNMGQNCVASSRIFVHSSIHDKFVEKFVEKIRKEIIMGNPMDFRVNYGPIIDRAQFERVKSYIISGIEEGAICEQGVIPDGKSLFIPPTVFTKVDDNMKIAKEEIFGPVACIFSYNTLDEAINRANNTEFGLAAGMVTDSNVEFDLFSKKIVAGIIYHNCYNAEDASRLPFVGHKASGVGALGDTGMEGFLNYSKPQSIITNIIIQSN